MKKIPMPEISLPEPYTLSSDVLDRLDTLTEQDADELVFAVGQITSPPPPSGGKPGRVAPKYARRRAQALRSVPQPPTLPDDDDHAA